MGIKERIEEFINLKGLTVKAFEQEIGISNGLWAKTKTVSEEVLLKVISRYNEINSEWLLKGTGEMFSSEGGDIESIDRLREENERLRLELRHKNVPGYINRESELFSLWMEHMRITEKMMELYQREKMSLA
jgi:hypothetical protein